MEASIIVSVENLQRIFAVVLALALGEGFKQVVSDKVQQPSDTFVYWNRIPGLVSFPLLILPFFQGMHRYYYTVYMVPTRPQPYAGFLSFDARPSFLLTPLCFSQWQEFWRQSNGGVSILRFYCC